MGNTCPAPHSRHEPFCETLHQDVAKSVHVDEMLNKIKKGDPRGAERAERARWKKLCSCFDGLKTDEERRNCASGTWECTANGREEAIKNPNCIGWVEYADAVAMKVAAERKKITKEPVRLFYYTGGYGCIPTAAQKKQCEDRGQKATCDSFGNFNGCPVSNTPSKYIKQIINSRKNEMVLAHAQSAGICSGKKSSYNTICGKLEKDPCETDPAARELCTWKPSRVKVTCESYLDSKTGKAICRYGS